MSSDKHCEWHVNGKTAAGYRIDSFNEEKTGMAFVLNPIAIVPDSEIAELICSEHNAMLKMREEAERNPLAISMSVGEID